MPAPVWIDYADDPSIAAMVVAGMSVMERVLREAQREGATRAIVRGEATRLPVVAPLDLTVEVVAPGAPRPDDARALPGDVVAGVQVTDERSRRHAEHALLQTCRRPHDGLGDRYVIRSCSLRITRVLAGWNVTPNQVTWVNIFVGLAACAAAMRGVFALAGLLIFLQVVLDSCDGELARICYRSSTFGMQLDNVSDDVIDNLFVAALGLGLGGPWRVIGPVAAGLRACCALMIYRAVARDGRPGDVTAFRWWFDRPDDDLAERFEHKLTPLAILRATGRRDLYCLLWAAACLAGVPVAALVMGGAMCIGYFALAVVHLTVTWRRG